MLAAEIAKRGWEVIASGVDRGHLHHAGIAAAAEPVMPWVMGQPYRLQRFVRILDAILSQTGVWPARGDEIVSAWTKGISA